MKTRAFGLLTVISLLFLIEVFHNSAVSQGQSNFTQELAKIERVELDKVRVVIPCPPRKTPISSDNPCYKDDRLVKVQTIVTNPQNIALTYQYVVTGGRIFGEGDKIVWDLKDVRPGTYTITAAITGANNVSSEIVLKEVDVDDFCCCYSCSCPSLSVVSSEYVKAGTDITFKAQTVGGEVEDFDYKWTISGGEIVAGAEPSEIIVKTDSKLIGKNITATVEISNSELCYECPKTASATVRVKE